MLSLNKVDIRVRGSIGFGLLRQVNYPFPCSIFVSVLLLTHHYIFVVAIAWGCNRMVGINCPNI